MIMPEAFSLLADLEANNNKVWFDAHRAEIRNGVQLPFQAVLEQVTEALQGTKTPFNGGAQTMFRMNRDIRFSKDKAPYNPQVSGLLSRSGTKSEMSGLTYLCMDKTGGFAATGFYNLSPSDLAPIRDRIAEDPSAFGKVVRGLEAAGLRLSGDGALKSMPRGYAQFANTSFADYLKLTSFIVRKDLKPKDWISGHVVDQVAQLTASCSSLIAFGTIKR